MSLWFFLGVAVVANSQIGRAIAARIRGGAGGGGGSGKPWTAADLEAAEHRLEDRFMELEERLEYTERLLQQRRASEGLPPIA